MSGERMQWWTAGILWHDIADPGFLFVFLLSHAVPVIFPTSERSVFSVSLLITLHLPVWSASGCCLLSTSLPSMILSSASSHLLFSYSSPSLFLYQPPLFSMPSPISNPLSLLLPGIEGSPMHSGMWWILWLCPVTHLSPLAHLTISVLTSSFPPATPLCAFHSFTFCFLCSIC